MAAASSKSVLFVCLGKIYLPQRVYIGFDSAKSIMDGRSKTLLVYGCVSFPCITALAKVSS